MIKQRSKKWLVINILCVLIFMGVVTLTPIEVIQKRRLFLLVVCLFGIAALIYEYQIQKTARLTWTEPKRITLLRRKAEIVSQFRLTSWSRVIILLLLVLVPLQIIMPHWYYLPLILSIAVLYSLFLVYLFFYVGKEIIIMDESGIRVHGKLRKFLYDKMRSVELAPNPLGGYSLAWNYEGINIVRGIGQEVDISEVKALIESNSKLEVKLRQP